LPLTTLGQETRWAYSTPPPSPHASTEESKAPSGVGYGEGCPLPRRLGGLGSVVSYLAGSGAEPRPLSHFLHILGHRTLLVARKIRLSCSKYKEKLVLQYCETSNCLKNCKFHFEKVVVTVTTTLKSGGDNKSPSSHVQSCAYAYIVYPTNDYKEIGNRTCPKSNMLHGLTFSERFIRERECTEKNFKSNQRKHDLLKPFS